MTEAVRDSGRLAKRLRRSRMKVGIRDYAADLKLIRPQPSREYWRALALGLLDLCQSRDPALVRLLWPLILKYARADSATVSTPDQYSDLRPALADHFANDLSGTKNQLGRGKGKEPPTISDLRLLELYEALKPAIAAIRRLERDMKSDRVAELIVKGGGFFSFSPFPPGRESREAIARDLAQSTPAVRVGAFFKAAADWSGLPEPSPSALREAYRHFVAERALGEATILILSELLIQNSVKTVENRLNRARRALKL